jgi:hypothetical protein
MLIRNDGNGQLTHTCMVGDMWGWPPPYLQWRCTDGRRTAVLVGASLAPCLLSLLIFSLQTWELALCSASQEFRVLAHLIRRHPPSSLIAGALMRFCSRYSVTRRREMEPLASSYCGWIASYSVVDVSCVSMTCMDRCSCRRRLQRGHCCEHRGRTHADHDGRWQLAIDRQSDTGRALQSKSTKLTSPANFSTK